MSEVRLIDANALQRKLYDDYHGAISDSELKVYQVIRLLEEAPTVTAEVLRHAYWELMDGTCNHAKEFRCSGAEGCGESIHYDHYTRFCEYEFCPNCGAKMDRQREGDAE